MTLQAFLENLPADPTSASPPLLVAEGLLSPAQREYVIDAYQRRPYAVIVGLPRQAPRRLHNGLTRLTGAVEVHLMHPPTSGALPSGDALADLQALIARAPNSVT